MKVKLRIKKEELKKKLGLKNGVDGKDADEKKIVEEVLSKVPAPIFPTEQLEEMRKEIELLREIEEKYKELEQKIAQIPKGRIGGAKGFQLLTDGTKRGLTVNTMNLIAGTGVSLTYSYSQGRNDVTISTSGGGILTATGTVNGTNDTFTFTSAPTILIVDGVPRQKVQSDGTVNWTGTTTVVLTIPPNYDIYGIA